MLAKQLNERQQKAGLELFIFTADEAAQYWEELEPFIMRSIAVSLGTITVEDVKKMLLKGEAIAFGCLKENALTCVVVARPIYYARYTAVRITACSGKGLKEALDWMPVLENWGNAMEAIELEAWCRPGMQRLLRRFGWIPKFTQMTKPIRRNLQ